MTDIENEVRLDSIAVGAVGDLLILIGASILRKQIEVIMATAETYIGTNVKTLTITYRIEGDENVD